MLTVCLVVATVSSAQPNPAPTRWGPALLRQKAEWYATDAAKAAAASVIRYQSAEGGWPKNHDLLAPPASAAC